MDNPRLIWNMIIQRLFARRDYEGLDKKAKEELRRARNAAAHGLNLVRNVNNFDGKNYGVGLRNKLHDNALETFKNGFLKEEKERLLNETKKRKLIKRGGLGALAVGGAVAAGIGAKKMIDKKKAKKEEKK